MHIVVIQSGDTALHAASREGYVQIVELLLERKADINAQDKVRNI